MLAALGSVLGAVHGTQVHHRYREQHTQDWPRLALYLASAIHFGLGDAVDMRRPTPAKVLAAGVLPIAVPLLVQRARPELGRTAFLAYFALWHAPRQILRHQNTGQHTLALVLVHHIAESFRLDVVDLRSSARRQ